MPVLPTPTQEQIEQWKKDDPEIVTRDEVIRGLQEWEAMKHLLEE